MNCPNCGAAVADAMDYCSNCGAQLRGASEQPYAGGYAPQQPYNPPQYNSYNAPPAYSSEPQIPPEYKPIGAWGYFGYQLLFMIPIVGFILLLVFSFGGTSNVNLKSFARSYFCMFLIVATLVVILLLLGAGGTLLHFLRSIS